MRLSASSLRRHILDSSSNSASVAEFFRHIIVPLFHGPSAIADCNIDEVVKRKNALFLSRLSPERLNQSSAKNEYTFSYAEIKELIRPAGMSFCLIDRSFRLCPEDAKTMHKLFGKVSDASESKCDRHFLKIIGPYLTDLKEKQIEKYLYYLFTIKSNKKTIQRKNPLRCFTVTSLDQDRGSSTSHYEFNFKPIIRKGNIEKILVSIEDVSKSIAMEYSLNTLKKKDQSSIEQLSSISSMLQFEKELIVDFLLTTTNSLKKVKSLVEGKCNDEVAEKERIDEIFRIAHQVKGDAAALGFKFLAKETHNFESALDGLKFRRPKTLGGCDLSVLVEPLKKIIDSLVNIRGLMNHLTDLEWSQEVSPEELSPEVKILRKMESLAAKVSSEARKKVKVIDDFTATKIPRDLQGGIQDMLIQLVRNAIIHGIEAPKVRLAYAKTSYGCIHISSRKTRNGLIVSVRDDGAGIDPWKIRNAALSSGKYGKECVARWKDSEIFELIKAPGFSTSDSVTRHAGRGVGLDVIDAKSKKLGGKLTISSKKNIFTQFKITIPD